MANVNLKPRFFTSILDCRELSSIEIHKEKGRLGFFIDDEGESSWIFIDINTNSSESGYLNNKQDLLRLRECIRKFRQNE